MNQIKIGGFIAELRKSQNMTQSEMAQKLGVSNKSVSRWETGRNIPDVSLFIPICEMFNISVNELIIGERIEDNIEEKTANVIIDTIDKSNRKISKARLIFYVAVLIVEIGLMISLSLTASPSDAMAVPLAGLLITSITATVIGFLDIKFLYKLVYISLSVIIFFATQILYWGDIDKDEFFVYSALIIVSQLLFILLASGFVLLIKHLKKK